MSEPALLYSVAPGVSLLVLMTLLLLFLALASPSSYASSSFARFSAASGQVLDRIVAIVGPQVITLTDARAAVALGLLPDAAAGQGPPGLGDLRPGGSPPGQSGLGAPAMEGASSGADVPLASVVERLVRRELMRAEIERFGVAAPAPDAIEAQLAAVRRRFASPAALAAALETHGLSEARLRAWVVDDLRIEQYLQQRFDAAAQPTDEDVLQYYQSREREFTEDGRPRPFAEVRDEARRRLQAARRQALIDDWVTGLMRRTEIVILRDGGDAAAHEAGGAADANDARDAGWRSHASHAEHVGDDADGAGDASDAAGVSDGPAAGRAGGA